MPTRTQWNNTLLQAVGMVDRFMPYVEKFDPDRDEAIELMNATRIKFQKFADKHMDEWDDEGNAIPVGSLHEELVRIGEAMQFKEITETLMEMLLLYVVAGWITKDEMHHIWHGPFDCEGHVD